MTTGNLLSTTDLATTLGVSKQLLAKWRMKRGAGPRFIAVGRRVMYDPADIKAWLESRRRHSTSDGNSAERETPSSQQPAAA